MLKIWVLRKLTNLRKWHRDLVECWLGVAFWPSILKYYLVKFYFSFFTWRSYYVFIIYSCKIWVGVTMPTWFFLPSWTPMENQILQVAVIDNISAHKKYFSQQICSTVSRSISVKLAMGRILRNPARRISEKPVISFRIIV